MFLVSAGIFKLIVHFQKLIVQFIFRNAGDQIFLLRKVQKTFQRWFNVVDMTSRRRTTSGQRWNYVVYVNVET